MKRCVNKFLEWLRSPGNKAEDAEARLCCARQKLHDHITRIDLGRDKGQVDLLISKDWSEVRPGVKHAESRLPTKTCTSIDSIMEPGATMPRHYHRDQSEVIFVVEGEITDLDTNVTTKEGETYFVEPGQSHTIHAKTNTLLNVVCRPKFGTVSCGAKRDLFSFTPGPSL